MATYAENLVTARDHAAERLVEVLANPKPSYTIADQSVDWTEYVRMLRETLRDLNAQIAQAEPFEVGSEGLA